MTLNRSQLTYFCGFIVLVLSLVFIFNLNQLDHKRKINEQIITLSQGEYLDVKEFDLEEVEVLIAYAGLQYRLKLFDEAVETYSQAQRNASQSQLSRIYYNLGNIHLSQAIAFAERTKVDQAVMMADIAKGYFRSTLMNQPDLWVAKYNYEAAQRLSRDLPLGDLVITEEAEESSAELWSAMPGFPVGLP